MPRHSHGEFGHIEFHWPIGFPLSKLVRSSYRVKQSWIEYMFLYRTQSSANLRTEDLMLSRKSFIKKWTGSLLKMTPEVHRITLGLDLRLDHLKLLVECAQRATSLSTCGRTLLSHSSPIYVIASCVTPIKGLCEIHYDQICLFLSTIHSPIQVADDVVHKLDQLGFAGPLTSETMLTVSKYAI